MLYGELLSWFSLRPNSCIAVSWAKKMLYGKLLSWAILFRQAADSRAVGEHVVQEASERTLLQQMQRMSWLRFGPSRMR